MDKYIPRDYQARAIDAGVAYLQNPRLKKRNGVIVQPTGSGKSLVIAGIASKLDGPCVVFQPSREILQQNAEKLMHYGYKPGIFSASLGRREIGDITLATVGSVVSYVEHFGPVPYVLIDECHVVPGKGGLYNQVLDAMPKARVLGLTATPYRLASNSFGSELRFITRMVPRVFRDVVYHTQIGDLFKRGYLCPLKYRDEICIKREHLKLNSTGADYTDASVQQAMFEVGFVGRLQDQVERELDDGRKNVLVFTRFVDEARRLAAVVKGAAYVDSDTPSNDRKAILRDYKSGALRVVANVGIIALGFDYPELESVILGRPTISLQVYYQQIGRVVRPHVDKPIAHVIDMVGLSRQFGPIEDFELLPVTSTREPVDVNEVDWSSRTAHRTPYLRWEIASQNRPLTNIYFSERDDAGPVISASTIAKRNYWRRRMKKRKPKSA